MNLCVYGAVAVGGHIAARMTQAVENVTSVPRGSHLNAKKDLRLRVEDEIFKSNR